MLDTLWPPANGRSVWIRVPNNTARAIPARLWALAGRTENGPARAVAGLGAIVVLVLAAVAATAVIVLLIPVRVAVHVYGWARPASATSWHDEATARQAADLALIRAALPTPTPPPPPPAATPMSPWPSPGPAPSTIYTAPHYVRVPPPAGLGPRPAHRARRAGAVIAHGWLLFKLLAIAGFIYAAAIGCLISVAADHLNDRTQLTTEEPAP